MGREKWKGFDDFGGDAYNAARRSGDMNERDGTSVRQPWMVAGTMRIEKLLPGRDGLRLVSGQALPPVI